MTSLLALFSVAALAPSFALVIHAPANGSTWCETPFDIKVLISSDAYFRSTSMRCFEVFAHQQSMGKCCGMSDVATVSLPKGRYKINTHYFNVAQGVFSPTYVYTPVFDCQSVPPGLEIIINLDGSGGKQGRIPQKWVLSALAETTNNASVSLRVDVHRYDTFASVLKSAESALGAQPNCVSAFVNGDVPGDKVTVEELDLFDAYQSRRVKFIIDDTSDHCFCRKGAICASIESKGQDVYAKCLDACIAENDDVAMEDALPSTRHAPAQLACHKMGKVRACEVQNGGVSGPHLVIFLNKDKQGQWVVGKSFQGLITKPSL